MPCTRPRIRPRFWIDQQAKLMILPDGINAGRVFVLLLTLRNKSIFGITGWLVICYEAWCARGTVATAIVVLYTVPSFLQYYPDDSGILDELIRALTTYFQSHGSNPLALGSGCCRNPIGYSMLEVSSANFAESSSGTAELRTTLWVNLKLLIQALRSVVAPNSNTVVDWLHSGCRLCHGECDILAIQLSIELLIYIESVKAWIARIIFHMITGWSRMALHKAMSHRSYTVIFPDRPRRLARTDFREYLIRRNGNPPNNAPRAPAHICLFTYRSQHNVFLLTLALLPSSTLSFSLLTKTHEDSLCSMYKEKQNMDEEF
nr:hypothetical protein CFP56_04511 [Quercus suber]